MLASPLKKNKINLADYSYQKDIEFRSIMAELSVFEVNVLTEIVHGSLKTKLTHLAEHLDVELSCLLPTLEKLVKTKLFQIERDSVIVDKEMRKYWESQIPKFNDEFRADMEFLRDLLNKVPIHVLPVWYSIPRSSDDIFQSIIEKYLLTPKTYTRYLEDLTFDEPILNEIMNELFSTPDFKIQAKTLIEKYALSRETFEEYMLQLEFNLVCCLSYNQMGDQWVEVITPFSEWRQYLRFQRDSSPNPIEDKSGLLRTHPNDFGFLQDINLIVERLIEEPLSLKPFGEGYTLPDGTIKDLFSRLPGRTPTMDYVSTIVDKLIQLQLAELQNEKLIKRKISSSWLEKSIQEQAIAIYRSVSSQSKLTSGAYIDRDIREIEKCLKKVATKGWIYFEDFAKACVAPIGENQPVVLMKKGKRWKYQIPEYREEDLSILKNYIFGTLFCVGMVSTGSHNSKLCFSVTPFGRMTLE